MFNELTQPSQQVDGSQSADRPVSISRKGAEAQSRKKEEGGKENWGKENENPKRARGEARA